MARAAVTQAAAVVAGGRAGHARPREQGDDEQRVEGLELGAPRRPRQLLDYHVAFAAEGVLLVCPERSIHRIETCSATAPRRASPERGAGHEPQCAVTQCAPEERARR